ncbi:hypothetical protein AVEN_225882-1 [Araneus ventricosus]|uniref:Uncharacterized protein n=1 Tax=Araneus ventricosus TaxID=182803 RepID=A0A4Y2BDC1_ARAVE|nr:hypothetical protein AVEN_225882-1 [Araneus ventricosus]
MALQVSHKRSSERMQCRRLASLMSELFIATTRETTDVLTRPRSTSILSVPTARNNANHGRNSRKDRPLERNFKVVIKKKRPLGNAYVQRSPTSSPWS